MQTTVITFCDPSKMNRELIFLSIFVPTNKQLRYIASRSNSSVVSCKLILCRVRYLVGSCEANIHMQFDDRLRDRYFGEI